MRQYRHPPQYLPGLTYTRCPISMPCTCEPFSTTTPAGSRPKIAGNGGRDRCGNQSTNLLSTLPRFGTIPQAFTSTSTSVGRGVGTSS